MIKDKLKEQLATQRSLLNYIVAFILGIGTGTIKFYLDKDYSSLFIIGILSLIGLIIFFGLTLKSINKKINRLEEEI